jgi:hypothetical protein
MPIAVPRVTFASCPVPYQILRDPPHTIDGDWQSGYKGDVSFVVAASDLATFCIWAGGSPYKITVGSSTVTRLIPVSHPDYSSLLCKKISSTAFGSFTPTNTPGLTNFSHARITLGFESVPFATDGSTPFMVTSTRAGSEVYTVAGSKLTFPSDGSTLQSDAGVTVPTIVYQVTTYLAPSLNDVTYGAILATPVNSAVFLGQPIGTMRFDSFSSETTMTVGGNAYQTTFMFTFRPVPWNQFLRPNFVWEAPTAPGGGYVYGASDLNVLLQ